MDRVDQLCLEGQGITLAFFRCLERSKPYLRDGDPRQRRLALSALRQHHRHLGALLDRLDDFPRP